MLNQSTRAVLRRLLLMLAAIVVSISAAACAAPRPVLPTGTATPGRQAAATAAPTATRLALPTPAVTSAPVATATTQVLAAEGPTAAATAKVRTTRQPAATSTPKARATKPPTATPNDGLPTISQAKLPREARETIRLIQAGGPFPFAKDGSVFQNREGLLPKRASGYYREYTVITPGSYDRGARRIIAGKGGELYYTADHYDSFRRVIP